MKHIASILLPFLVAMVCACSKETVQTDQEVRTPLPSLSDRTIHCYAPPVTRTAYGEAEEGAFPVIWKSGDAIRLWASDGSASADYSCAEDGADVAFSSETGLSGSGRLALYPAASFTGVSGGKMQVDLASLGSQVYHSTLADNSQNVKFFPLWAKESDSTPGQFEFHNLIGCVVLQLNDYEGLGLKINKVKITSSAYDILGEATLDPATGNLTLPAATNKNSVTITYNTGMKVSTSYIEKVVECFTVGLPAITYPAGDLTFEITDADGRVYTQNVSKALALNAGKSKKMAKLQMTLRYGIENCFVVAPGGTVNIDVTPKYTFSNRFDASTLQTVKDASGETYSVSLTKEVLWEQLPTTDSGAGSVIASSSLSGYTLTVTAGSAEGNALIAIKSGNTILWSYHIWVTDTPSDQTYVIGGDSFQMMDRHLGAVQAVATSDAESPLTFGTMYQWGRKDPVPSYSTAKNNRTFKHTSRVERVKGTHNVAFSIQNPTTIITYTSEAPWLGFVSDKAANAPLWGAPVGTVNSSTIKTVVKDAKAYVKTVFDPCPTGYQVPQGYRFTGISNSTIPSPANNGHAVLCNGTDTAYYPLAGAISSKATSATPTQVGARSHTLTATPYGTGGIQSLELQLVGSPSQVSGTSYAPQTMCGSVRCIKTSSL